MKAKQNDKATVRKIRQRAQAVRRQTRIAKARFDAAHHRGLEALAAKDYKAVDEAVREERDLIEAQRKGLRQQNQATSEVIQSLVNDVKRKANAKESSVANGVCETHAVLVSAVLRATAMARARRLGHPAKQDARV